MNFITRVSHLARAKLFPLTSNSFLRNFSVTPARHCEVVKNPEGAEVAKEKIVDTSIDRSSKIPPETSIRYLKSNAYQQTYGEKPVWVQYRRNHKGHHPPRKTRKTCIRANVIATGNPCPICRDEYLVLDYNNVDLLKQFISPYTGEVRKDSFDFYYHLEFTFCFSGFELREDWIVSKNAP